MKQKQSSIGQRIDLSGGNQMRSLSSSESMLAAPPLTAKQGNVIPGFTIKRILFALALVTGGGSIFLFFDHLSWKASLIQDALPPHSMPSGFYLLLQGAFIGISVAAPLGPVGILCMQRTLLKGAWHGLASGLGNALAIALYSAIAGFGMTVVSTFLLHQQTWIQILGGVFLLYLGVKTTCTRPAEPAGSVFSQSLLKDVLSTFLLSVVSPVTVLLFVAAFASLGLQSAESSAFTVVPVVVGVLLGSFFWQCVSTTGISLLRNTLLRGTQWMIWINVLSGGILFLLGCLALLSLLKAHL